MKINNVLIFTEISKKIGGGHYERASELKRKLNHEFNVTININLSKIQIKKILYAIKQPTLIIYDFKDHSKSIIKKNINSIFILMESNRYYQKNVISIDPLNLNKGYYNGPRWSCYPNDFFENLKFKKKKKNLLIAQGSTDAHGNIKKILSIIEPFILENNLQIFIKGSKFIHIPSKFKKYKNIKIINRIKKISFLLKKIDFAITSCGNFCHEINFFGIKAMYVTSEPREIRRAKKLESLNFGKYVKINDKKSFKLELNNFVKDKNFDKRNIKKIKFFRHNGMLNLINLILRITNNVQK
jgi:spore coat polysaccharide biosynthesis predicted glycosyltransferase SpsG